MKIVILHATMGLNHRGSEAVVGQLARSLAKKHNLLILQGGSRVLADISTIRCLKLVKTLRSEPKNFIDKILFRLYLDEYSNQIRRFTQKSLDHIHAFDPDIIVPINGAVQIQLIKSRFPSKKIAIFGHAGIGYHDRDSLKLRPDLFISLSQPATDWAKSIAHPSTKVVYIPNSIDQKYFSQAKPINFPLERPVVLTVAAFSKYKNIDKVIQAVSQTPASLVVVGRGEEKKKLKLLAKKMLPGRHLFFTANQEDMPKFYKSVDSFCFVPNPQEAFGRVYLEAMSAGLPIVAPDDQIRRKIIGKNGYYSDYQIKNITKQIMGSLGKKPINYQKELAPFDHLRVSKTIESELLGLM